MKIWYEHYKTKEKLYVEGQVIYGESNDSDRIVVELDDGSYEDIIKSTIIETRP